jgi:[ribosomal protein S5]-alanine N-acetyltransferase
MTIATERLDLIPLPPAFLAASLAGDRRRAARLLGLAIPADWFGETWLMRLRLEQLARNPALAPWLLRAIGLRAARQMVGHIGFHTAPGADYLKDLAPGGVEFGYTVYPPYRRQGLAREAAAGLMHWAHTTRAVEHFVLSISPDNTPSLRLAAALGFKKVGSHVDEDDGVEDIYERSFHAEA